MMILTPPCPLPPFLRMNGIGNRNPVENAHFRLAAWGSIRWKTEHLKTLCSQSAELGLEETEKARGSVSEVRVVLTCAGKVCTPG